MRMSRNWTIAGLVALGFAMSTPVVASERAWGVSAGVVTPGPGSGFKDAGVFTLAGDLETDSRWTAGATLGWQWGHGAVDGEHVDIASVGIRFGRAFRVGAIRAHPTAGLALYRTRREVPSTIVGFGSSSYSRVHVTLPVAMALEWSLTPSWRIGARESAHLLLDGLSVIDGVDRTSTWFSTELVLTRVIGER